MQTFSRLLLLGLSGIIFYSCTTSSSETVTLPETPRDTVLKPIVVTEPVGFDSDDPAIWINKNNPENSIIFGTDKDTQGAIWAFDLNGKILEDKKIPGVQRPNNVDLEYDIALGDSLVDIIVFTERERSMVRVFSVPDMRALDGGGFPVFENESSEDLRAPMGIAVYHHQDEHTCSFIVSRKDGPTEGYLWEYALTPQDSGFSADLKRKFGKFSGKKEIEALAVDDIEGKIYYSDEQAGVRVYDLTSDPAKEVAFFGQNEFAEDNEGIAFFQSEKWGRVLAISDQGAGKLRFYQMKEGYKFIKSVTYSATETDGIEATNFAFNKQFPKGMLVAMSDDKTFHFYSLGDFLE